MAFKFVALFAILAVANAGVPQLYQAPVAQVYQQSPTLVKQVVQSQPILTKTAVDEYDPNPQYSYSYDIQDSLTGDSKSQQESREGDVVRGQYTVNDADGFKRIVDYTADPINGFNAVVSREPLAVKSIVSQPIVKTAPIAYAAPATFVKSTPLTYAAPASYVKSAYTAPVSYYNSAPLAYAAPTTYVKSAYAAPASYINAAPLSYASAPASYVKGNYY